MPTRKFQRKEENFTCEWCEAEVKGTGYTDHCPACLVSKHVDVNPGDRASGCNGKMVPKSVLYQGGIFTINYQCIKCGLEKRMKAAQDDNQELLIQLAAGRPK